MMKTKGVNRYLHMMAAMKEPKCAFQMAQEFGAEISVMRGQLKEMATAGLIHACFEREFDFPINFEGRDTFPRTRKTVFYKMGQGVNVVAPPQELPNVTVRLVARLFSMLKSGVTRADIKTECGMSPATIADFVKTGKKLGLLYTCKWTPAGAYVWEEVLKAGDFLDKPKPKRSTAKRQHYSKIVKTRKEQHAIILALHGHKIAA